MLNSQLLLSLFYYKTKCWLAVAKLFLLKFKCKLDTTSQSYFYSEVHSIHHQPFITLLPRCQYLFLILPPLPPPPTPLPITVITQLFASRASFDFKKLWDGMTVMNIFFNLLIQLLTHTVKTKYFFININLN